MRNVLLIAVAALFWSQNVAFAQDSELHREFERGMSLPPPPFILERWQPSGDLDQIARRGDLVAITETRQVGGGDPEIVPYETVCRVIKCGKIQRESPTEFSYLVYKMILVRQDAHTRRYLPRCEKFVSHMNQLMQIEEFGYTQYELDLFKKVEKREDKERAIEKLDKCWPSVS